MGKLDKEHKVHVIAEQLGVASGSSPVAGVVDYCAGKISGWVQTDGPADSLVGVQEIVCTKLGLSFEEIWSDSDLDDLIHRKLAEKDPVFAMLRHDLDETTFGVTIRCRQTTKRRTKERYVGVIDCRGQKSSRRYFSKWHEIAHLLTQFDQMELIFHRTEGNQDPEERLMDAIAAEIGFYPPVFQPILTRHAAPNERLTFAAIENVREAACADASFQSTTFATVKRHSLPTLYIECRQGYKKHEEAFVNSGQVDMFPDSLPKPELRVQMVLGNDAARRLGLRIDRNMTVPEDSVIRQIHAAGPCSVHQSTGASDNLDNWRHSDGSSLGNTPVHVEAMSIRDSVVALVTPSQGID